MVYVFLADGFEEMEALAPVDILRRVGLTVKTVGVGTKTPIGSHGIPVVADILDTDVVFEDLQAVILPGGLPGTTNLENSPVVQTALDKAVEAGCLIAAICAAPSVLGHKGLLDGRRATCFPGFETELVGATYTGETVEVDGPIVTARGAGVATEFGLQLVSELCSPEKAEELRRTMQCR